MNNLITISGVRGFIDENGVAQLNLEDVARGLGFTRDKNGTEYVIWNRVSKYLTDFGFHTSVEKTNSPTSGRKEFFATSCEVIPTSGYGELLPEFIPENIFYRLAMKAKNETAETFQALVADEILPTIRKAGYYAINNEIAALKKQVNDLLKQSRDIYNPTPEEHLLRFFKEHCEMNPQYNIITINFYIKYQDWCRSLGLEKIKEKDRVLAVIVDNVPGCRIELFHVCYALYGVAWKDKELYRYGVI